MPKDDFNVRFGERVQEIIKLLETMTDAQLGIVYKMLLNLANMRPVDVPKSITQ